MARPSPTLAGAVCRVCGAPGTRAWADGWYCDDRACIDHRTWGRSLDPDAPRPPGWAGCPPGVCYCGRCPHARPRWHAELPDAVTTGAAARLTARAAANARTALPNDVDTVGVLLPREPRPTQVAAAMRALPRTGTQRRKVLDAILDAAARGHGGATDPELCRHLDLQPNSERPRRVELVGLGLVTETRLTRQHGGNPHVVWGPTTAALTLTRRGDTQ